jgi:4-coumarate--CoA ligase
MDYTTRVFTHPRRNAEDPIFVNADSPTQRVTWKTYSSCVKRAAVSLRKLRLIQPGDCVGLLSHSDIYYWVLADAVIAAGGIFSPLPIIEREDQLAIYIAAANIKCLFVSQEYASLVPRTAAVAPKVLIFDSPAQTDPPPTEGHSFTSLLLSHESEWKQESFGCPEQRIALRTFTSGTTGGIKAVEISHAALVARIDAKDFVPSPNDHSHLQFIHLASGSSQIICQRAAAGYLPIYVTAFDDELSIIDRIKSCEISLIQLPPRTMELIADAIESGKRPAKSLESLNHILVGGSPSHKDQVSTV